MPKLGLTEADFKEAARLLNCEVAAIKAVAEVESRGGGFLPTGEPTILFERHIFSRRTAQKFDKAHPKISNPKAGGYGKVSEQHTRLAMAASLNRSAALESASWGMFQIMGFNAFLCGFNTLQAFINAMFQSERAQLLAFIEYIRQTHLSDELREHRWADFARKYNGPDFQINNYDVKLKKAFIKHSQ